MSDGTGTVHLPLQQFETRQTHHATLRDHNAESCLSEFIRSKNCSSPTTDESSVNLPRSLNLPSTDSGVCTEVHTATAGSSARYLVHREPRWQNHQVQDLPPQRTCIQAIPLTENRTIVPENVPSTALSATESKPKRFCTTLYFMSAMRIEYAGYASAKAFVILGLTNLFARASGNSRRASTQTKHQRAYGKAHVRRDLQRRQPSSVSWRTAYSAYVLSPSVLCPERASVHAVPPIS